MYVKSEWINKTLTINYLDKEIVSRKNEILRVFPKTLILNLINSYKKCSRKCSSLKNYRKQSVCFMLVKKSMYSIGTGHFGPSIVAKFTFEATTSFC